MHEATRVQDKGGESRVWMTMSILRYLVPIDGLPDPKGPLLSEIPSSIITEVNRQVWKATSKVKQQKHGSYQVFSPFVCMNIGSYACQHGVSSAARVFSKQLDTRISESTVRSIRDKYKEEVRRKRSADNSTVSVLSPRKHGRCLLLGEKMDTELCRLLDLGNCKL